MIRILASHLRGLICAAFNSPTIKFALSLMVLTTLTLPPVAVAQPDEFASMSSPKALTLMNGWYNAPYATSNAEVEVVNGIVHFKGAIASHGTSQEPFVLPQGFRPAKIVFIPVDLFAAQKGHLFIFPSGVVYVQALNAQSNATAFTSLDGASFALNSSGFTALTLLNGWKEYRSEVGMAGVKNINGIVHFRGAIATNGTNTVPFVLPAGFRPAKTVRIAVDLCGVTNGRLNIYPNGKVEVQSETAWFEAQCFTSLDGAWFATKDSGFKTLPLLNSWTSYGGAFQPGAELFNGIVYLRGAIYSAGADADAFVLPSSMTPTKDVYIPVNLCGATKGRLNITTDGYVAVQAENSFANAQCFTSLDGVSFVK